MLKRIIIPVLCLIVLGLGFVAFKLIRPNSNSPDKNKTSWQTKFISAEQILSNDVVVRITDGGFIPQQVTVKKGARVVWINQTNNYVWPASDPHPTHTDYPGFDPLEPYKNGEVWYFVFEKIGSWGYHDHINPGFRGKIIVTD